MRNTRAIDHQRVETYSRCRTQKAGMIMKADLVRTARFTGRLLRESLKLSLRVAAILSGAAGGAAVHLAKSMPDSEDPDARELRIPEPGVFFNRAEHAGGYEYVDDGLGNSR